MQENLLEVLPLPCQSPLTPNRLRWHGRWIYPVFSPLTTSRWLLPIPLGANLVWERIALLSLHQQMRSALLTASLTLLLVWALLSLKGHEEEKVPGFLRGARWRASSLQLLCYSSCGAPVPSMGHGLGLEITDKLMALKEQQSSAECTLLLAPHSGGRRRTSQRRESSISMELKCSQSWEVELEGGAVGRDTTLLQGVLMRTLLSLFPLGVSGSRYEI